MSTKTWCAHSATSRASLVFLMTRRPTRLTLFPYTTLFRSLSTEVAKHLKAVRDNGTPIYFVHGNRDFIMRDKYAKQAGMTLLPEQMVIDLYGTPTVILHGDEMCTQDIEYQKFRKKGRGWWWPRLMLAMPLWYRRKVAQNAREKSKQNQAGKALEILDVTEEAVLDTFAKHQVEHMIHSHTHRPNVHHHQVDNQTHTRTVLGDEYTQGAYLVVTEHTQTLVSEPFAQT